MPVPVPEVLRLSPEFIKIRVERGAFNPDDMSDETTSDHGMLIRALDALSHTVILRSSISISVSYDCASPYANADTDVLTVYVSHT